MTITGSDLDAVGDPRIQLTVVAFKSIRLLDYQATTVQVKNYNDRLDNCLVIVTFHTVLPKREGH